LEARVAASLVQLDCDVQYEYKTGAGEQSVDFRVLSKPEVLIEAISIQNSEASNRAGSVQRPARGIARVELYLNSMNPDQRQTPGGEMVRVVELLSNKASKFPEPKPGVYHLVVADLRGYNGGDADLDDCRQIAWGPDAVMEANRLPFTQEEIEKSEPVRGLFDPANPNAQALRAQKRVHAIGLFCGSEGRSEDVLSTYGSFYHSNSALISQQEADLVVDLLDRNAPRLTNRERK